MIMIHLPKKPIATHSSLLAWKIPWTEEPDGLQSKGLQRAGHQACDANIKGKKITLSFDLLKDNNILKS